MTPPHRQHQHPQSPPPLMKLALISAVVSEPTALSDSPLSPLLTNCPFPSALQSPCCYPHLSPLVCARHVSMAPSPASAAIVYIPVCMCAVLQDKANLNFPASGYICSLQACICVCVCNLRLAALVCVCVCVRWWWELGGGLGGVKIVVAREAKPRRAYVSEGTSLEVIKVE